MSNSGILVLNAGSSSLRFAVFDAEQTSHSPALLLRGQISGIGSKPVFRVTNYLQQQDDQVSAAKTVNEIDSHRKAIELTLTWIRNNSHDIQLIGAGHRVVHGGPDRKHHARVTPELLEELDTLSILAPHHQPHNLEAIRALAKTQPDLPQFACFDTAFHVTQDTLARTLPLPRTLRDQGLQRYGFHGLSYEYICSVVPDYNHGQLPANMIIAHLGNGASLCALKNGSSIASSMGFSTLDGLMMGTRCGSLDPGVLLHLMREFGMDEAALSRLLYNESGLLGVSGISADMQVLLNSDDPGAKEAIELFCYTLQRAIGSMAAALQGVDALVFTGGIGENAAAIRQQVCTQLAWLGLDFDVAANLSAAACLSHKNSKVKLWVIPTNEEQVIAQHTLADIRQHPTPSSS